MKFLFKQILLFLLCGVILFGVIGCSNTTTTKTTNSSSFKENVTSTTNTANTSKNQQTFIDSTTSNSIVSQTTSSNLQASSSVNTSTSSSEVIKKALITFVNENNILQQFNQTIGELVVYNGTTPTKENTSEYTYTFLGWSKTPNGEVIDLSTQQVTTDQTYYAIFNAIKNTYLINFYVESNLVQSETLEYGTQIAFKQTTPTKTSNAELSFTFVGWSKTPNGEIASLETVIEHTNYYAIFTSATNIYPVTFIVNDTIVQQANLEYNSTITYNGSTPTKAQTDEYIYTFAGWSTTENGEIVNLGKVKGETTFYAIFNSQYISYGVKNGTFTQNGDLITSTSANALAIKNSATFTQGTLSVTMNMTKTGGDNGIVFGITNLNNQTAFWEENVSYYFFFLSIGNSAYLGKVNNGGWQLCQTTPYNVQTGTYQLEVSVDRETKMIRCFINGKQTLGFIDNNLLLGEQFGVRAGTNEISYQNPTTSNQIKVPSFNASEFSVASGNIGGGENFVNTVGANTIAYRTNDYFRYGYLEVTMRLSQVNGCNGIIFGLSHNVNTFWEQNGVSYYFLYVTNGRVDLGKTANGAWTHCGGEYSAIYQGEVKLGVYRDINTIYIFVDGKPFLTYKDNAMLTGIEYGIRAGDGGTAYTNFINLSGQDVTNAGLHGLTIYKGGATGTNHELGNVVKFTAENTLAMFNSSFTSGTIKSDISPNKCAPHWANGPIALSGKTGIVFGYVDDNNCYKFFTEGESEQVKLCKYTNGVEEVLFSNYMSATQLWNYVRPFEYKVILTNGKAYCYFYERLFTVNNVTIPNNSKAGIFSDSKDAIAINTSASSDTFVQTVDTLLFGHSYFDCWVHYKDDLANAGLGTIKNIGLGGSIASQWDNFRSAIVAYQPKNIIYMIGINDVSAGITPQATIDSIKSLCNYLKTALPNVKITLVGTPHCPARWTGSGLDVKNQVTELNALERAYVSQNENFLNYVETEYMFCEGTTPLSKYFFDDLHPTKDSYAQKIAPAILATIKGDNTVKNIRTNTNCETTNFDSNFASSLNSSTNGLNLTGKGLRLDKTTHHKDIGVSFKISSSQDIALAGVLLRGSIVNGKINGILINLVSTTNKFLQVFYLNNYDLNGNGTADYIHGWIYPGEVKDVVFNVLLVGNELKLISGNSVIHMDISTYLNGSASTTRNAYTEGYFGVLSNQTQNNNLEIYSLAIDSPYMWNVLAPIVDAEIVNDFKYYNGIQKTSVNNLSTFETNTNSVGISGKGSLLHNYTYHSNVSYSFSVSSNSNVSSVGTLLRANVVNNSLNGYFINVVSNETQKYLQVFKLTNNNLEYIHGWIYSAEVKNVTFNVTLVGNKLTITDNNGGIISMDLATNSGGTDGLVQREVYSAGYFGIYCDQTTQTQITLTNINM